MGKYSAGLADPYLVNPSGDLAVYFGGKLVGRGTQDFWNRLQVSAYKQDRLGSAVKTFPYGEERTPTGTDGFKFATYWRDTATNLDYALNRYYTSQWGGLPRRIRIWRAVGRRIRIAGIGTRMWKGTR